MKWYIKVLTNYATFSGRARRKEYWMFVLVNTLISIVLIIIGELGSAQFEMLANLYSFAVLLPSIAVGVRRMHDVNKSGWFILIPIYNLILSCTKGNQGDNQYGPDPKEGIGDNPEILHS